LVVAENLAPALVGEDAARATFWLISLTLVLVVRSRW
jgi:hypothetical protein